MNRKIHLQLQGNGDVTIQFRNKKVTIKGKEARNLFNNVNDLLEISINEINRKRDVKNGRNKSL